MPEISIRPFRPYDVPAVRELTSRTLAAYRRHSGEEADKAPDIAELADLARTGSVFVAEDNGQIAGAIGYTPPGVIDHPLFSPRWALIRMLVVAEPSGNGPVAASLIAACVEQAHADKAVAVAVYSWPTDIMFDPEFRRQGFADANVEPEIFGNLHALLLLNLGPSSE